MKATQKTVDIGKIIADLDELRRFSGNPAEFWGRFIKDATLLTGTDFGMLLVKGGDEPWKRLLAWPSARQPGLDDPVFLSHVERIAGATAEGDGFYWEELAGVGFQGNMAGVHLDLGEEQRTGIALFYAGKDHGMSHEDRMVRLRLLSDIPLLFQTRRVAEKAKNDVLQFAEALDLMTLLNAEKKYMAAAMAFCNEIASRFGCSRVSLGWLKEGYIRVQAISHMEKFEKKMDAVQHLEAAMEETFDQDEEVVFPKPGESTTVTRDHEAFAAQEGVKNMLSLPLRLDDKPEGVLTCERENPFSETDIHGLRLICDQASRRLGDLKKHDRWFGPRMLDSAREHLSKLLGVEHTLAKCIGIIVCILLAFLLFGKWQYRVEAPFILKTDDLAYLPAPFDGYIDKVHVQVGDVVKEQDILLSLDTGELLLEESAAIADQTRYGSEAEKARARNDLAEMKISLALKAQAEAKLDLIRYHLANAELRAPFAGVVVEGDLKELQGAPVRKGDVLFKVALVEKMYAELDLSERDIHEIAVERPGEIAFVSMPEKKFPIRVEVINPVAATKKEGNVFPVRCAFTGPVESWWRPGMSGIAKVSVGKRNILWIFTHRTIDYFRLLLWM